MRYLQFLLATILLVVAVKALHLHRLKLDTEKTDGENVADEETDKWRKVENSFQIMIYATALQNKQFSDCEHVFAKDFYGNKDGVMAGIVQCDGEDVFLEAKSSAKFQILAISDTKPQKVVDEGFPTWMKASLMKNSMPPQAWKTMEDMAEASKNASDCTMNYMQCDVNGLNPGGPIYVCKESCPVDGAEKVAYKTMTAPTDLSNVNVNLVPASDFLRHVLRRLYRKNTEKPVLPETWETMDNDTKGMMEGSARMSSNFSSCGEVEVYPFYQSDSGRFAGLIECDDVKNYVEAKMKGKFNVLTITTEEPAEVSQGMPTWMGAQLLESGMPKPAWAIMCQFLSATKNSSGCVMTMRDCSFSAGEADMKFVCKETCPTANGANVAYKTMVPPEHSQGPPEIKFFPADMKVKETLEKFYEENDDDDD